MSSWISKRSNQTLVGATIAIGLVLGILQALAVPSSLCFLFVSSTNYLLGVAVERQRVLEGARHK